MNFYGATGESDEKRKNNFVVPSITKGAGTGAQGNSTCVANNTEATSVQVYYTCLRSVNKSHIYDLPLIKLRELSVSYPVYTSK